MKYIKEYFRRNGLMYKLLERNKYLALYGVGGTHSDNINYYEVDKIQKRVDKYGEREALPTNEQFGRDRSRCFNNYTAALEYFIELTYTIESELQSASKPVTVLPEVPEMIPEYQNDAA